MSVGLLSFNIRSFAASGTGPPPDVTTDVWQFLKLGNGGLIIHGDVHADGSMVGGTDSFGMYYWNSVLDRWVQMLTTDCMQNNKLIQEGGGCEDIKIARSNSSVVWISQLGNIYKSIDGGRTCSFVFRPPNLNGLYFNASPNRTSGPFLAIDPVNPNHVLVSTPCCGTYRSTNGTSFAQVPGVGLGLTNYVNNTPSVRNFGTDTSSHFCSSSGAGTPVTFNVYSGGTLAVNDLVYAYSASDRTVAMYGTVNTINSPTSFTMTPVVCSGFNTKADWFIAKTTDEKQNGVGSIFAFDTSAGTVDLGGGNIVTKNIYASTYGVGTFFTSNGGANFFAVTGAPSAFRNMACDPSGVLWFVDDDYPASVPNTWKYDGGTWTRLFTGLGQWYNSVTVDWTNSSSKSTAVVAFCQGDNGFFDISNDGGATWGQQGSTTGRIQVTPPGDVVWMNDLFNAQPGYFFAHGSAVFDPNPARRGRLWSWGEGVWYMTPSPRLPITFAGGGSPNITVNVSSYPTATPLELVVGHKIRFHSEGGTLAGGLYDNYDIYIVSVAGNVIQVSLNAGGTPYTFADTGTGVQTCCPMTITITQQSRGIEEFIGNNVLSIPSDSGAAILSTWDFPVFWTNTFDQYPSLISGTQGPNQTGLSRGYAFDYIWNEQDTVIGVFQDGAGNDTGSGISRNGKGRPGAWTAFAVHPTLGGQGGHIAAADHNVFVCVPTGTGADLTNEPPRESLNGGAGWTVFPMNVTGSYNSSTGLVTLTLPSVPAYPITGSPAAGTIIKIASLADITYTIVSGTYNSTTGAVQLTLSATPAWPDGTVVFISGLTGTGTVDYLGGFHTVTILGAVISFTSYTGLTLTVTGGSVVKDISALNKHYDIASISGTTLTFNAVTGLGPITITAGQLYGSTWNKISIPGGTPLYGWQPNGNPSTYSKSIDSDKTTGDLYLYNVNGGSVATPPGQSAVYKRTKSTGLWSTVKSPFDFTGELNYNGKLRAIPGSYGLTGHLWFTGGFGAPPHPGMGRPLYYTTDGWSSSHIVAGFTEVAAIGFGASFTGHEGYPTVFVAGWYNPGSGYVYGVYMCKNFNTAANTGTWTRLGPISGTLADGQSYSLPLNTMGLCSDIDGDKTIPGQVYMQTTASGAFWGRWT